MFARLAKSGLVFGLAKFWPVEPRRSVPRLVQAVTPTPCNDNLPGLRRPAVAGRRRAPTPALACHWVDRGGRLECRWQAEPDGDAPSGGLGESGATGGAPGLQLTPRSHRGSQNRLRTVLSGSSPDSSEQRSSEADGERAADLFDLVCCTHVTRRCHLMPASARLLPIANSLQ
jgi:hypothetical protein